MCLAFLFRVSLYWNMTKELSHVKPADIPLSSFEANFKSVNNPLDPFFTLHEDVIHFNERCVTDEFCITFGELNVNFSHDEVLKTIKQLKTNKSGGPDRLIDEFFKWQKCIITCFV